MLGLNWIDALIVLILAVAVYASVRSGFLRLTLVLAGFFGALLLGGWLFPKLLKPIDDKAVLALMNGNLVLIFAVYAGFKGYDLGRRWHWSLNRWRWLESLAGVTIGSLAVLACIWLLAAAICTLPFAGLSNSVNSALIVQKLDERLPPVPSVFNRFSQLINPNTPPRVFIKEQPGASLAGSPMPPASSAVIKAGESVIRVTSFGCGGLTGGSGFAIGPDLIITNAHVIAGVKRPIVKYGARSFEAVPILFDANQDLAMLRVSGLNAAPLKLTNQDLVDGSQTYIIGYPQSIYKLVPGIIRNDLQIVGTNIYGEGNIERQVYEIQATVDQGNSGSPVLTGDGRVAGLIFSNSDDGSYGYAINSASLINQVNRAQHASRRVSTGICFKG
jgi:S1-C subfamily serine protease